jgi:hypothetical protein
MMASRGFTVKSEGNGTDTILPREIWDADEAELVFALFDDPSARSALLCLAEKQDINSFDLSTELQKKINKLTAMDDFKLTREAFSHTFEWYVGELLVRSFGAFSSSYGVKIDDIKRNSDSQTSGDFDVLSVLGSMEMAYIECKTGDYTAKKISNMLERALSLHAPLTIMFAENISQRALCQKISTIKYPGLAASPALLKSKIVGLDDSEIYQWHDTFFVSANTNKLNVAAKLRAVFRLWEFKKAAIQRLLQPSDEDYMRAGYSIEKI